MRQKVPFGIAQIGKAFRNEITPRPGQAPNHTQALAVKAAQREKHTSSTLPSEKKKIYMLLCFYAFASFFCFAFFCFLLFFPLLLLPSLSFSPGSSSSAPGSSSRWRSSTSSTPRKAKIKEVGGRETGTLLTLQRGECEESFKERESSKRERIRTSEFYSLFLEVLASSLRASFSGGLRGGAGGVDPGDVELPKGDTRGRSPGILSPFPSYLLFSSPPPPPLLSSAFSPQGGGPQGVPDGEGGLLGIK